MKELVNHIEALLLDNDCVILPQIGGFVTCNVPAQYVEEEDLFLPPYRTVGFNENLKADDGLLIQSYMAVYGNTETEARNMLGEQIREVQQNLWENGTYDLGSIGILTLDEQNNIHFSPCQAGTVCPAYYGLDAVVFGMVKTDAATPAAPVMKADTRTNNKEEITIRLKKAWLNNIAAVAAVLLTFLLFTPDAKNTTATSQGKDELAQFMNMMPNLQPMQGESIRPQAKPIAPEVPEPEQKTAAETPKEEVAAPAVTVPEEEPADCYCVVLASAIPEKNAEAYAAHLIKEGYSNAQVLKKGRMIRVVLTGYASENEARTQARSLRDKSEDFDSAWVLHLK